MDAGNPSDSQWDALFNYIEYDEEMRTGQLLHPGAKARVIKKWSSLAVIVNSVEGATAQKDDKQWKAAWNGMKCRARAAFRKAVKPLIAAGLPVPDINEVKLSNPHYKRVIQMTGVDAALASLNVNENNAHGSSDSNETNVNPDLPQDKGDIEFDEEGARANRSTNACRNSTGEGTVAGLGLSDRNTQVLNYKGITAAIGNKRPDPLRIQLQAQAKEKPREKPLTADDAGADVQEGIVQAETPVVVSNIPVVLANTTIPIKTSLDGIVSFEDLTLDEAAGPIPETFDDVKFLMDLPDNQEEKWAWDGLNFKDEPCSPMTDIAKPKMIHTPPRGSNLTPAQKRAHLKREAPEDIEVITLTDTPVNNAQSQSWRRKLSMDNQEKQDDTLLSLKAAIVENTEVMKKVLEALQSKM